MNERVLTPQGTPAASLRAHQGDLLQRRCACGTHTTGGGECAECGKKKLNLQRKRTIGSTDNPLEPVLRGGMEQRFGYDFANVSLHTGSDAGRSELPIGRPGDAYEREADEAAAQVMTDGGMPELSSLSPSAPLQRLSAAHSPRRSDSGDLAGRLHGRCGQGEALPQTERAFFEPRFGRDFGAVRVHADSEASRMARAIDARAFTYGSDLYFGNGEYRPGSDTGRSLMAHELAHVVQQQGGAVSIQRQCVSGAACTRPICGEPGPFNCAEGAAEAPARAAAPQSPNRADDLEALATANHLPLTTVFGVFTDRDMSAGTGALLAGCRDFITWPSAGTPSSSQDCVFVPAELEREAETFRSNPNQARIGRQTRSDWLSDTLQGLTHELAHERVTQTPLPATTGVGAGCAGSTTLFHCASSGEDFDIDFYLDELNAILSEFPELFAHVRRHTARGDYGALLGNLQREYWDPVFNCDEGINGILTALRCASGCSCADVDAHVRKTTQYAIAHHPGVTWDTTTRGVFQDLMNSKFPVVRYPRDAAVP
jgi:hypothetical protein